MIRFHRSIVAVATLGALSMSCHDASAPPEARVTGYYTVESVNGAPLPADISADASGRTVLMLETLSFDGAGSAVLSMATLDSVANSAPQLVSSTVALRYRVTGSEIDFTVICPLGAFCVSYPPATILDATRLRIQSGRSTYLLRKIAVDPVQ